MPTPPFQTILFDWDGTLCDSGPASLRAFRKSLEEFGVTFTDEEYRSVYTPRWYRMYEALRLPEHCWRDADQRWLHHYRDEEPGLIAGAAGILESLRDREMRLGIVTNGTQTRIRAIELCADPCSRRDGKVSLQLCARLW